MGIFSKIKNGLAKTKDSVMGKIEGVLNSFTKIDEDLFEELEEMLILSDMGAQTSSDICDIIRKKVKEKGVTDPSEIKGLFNLSIQVQLLQ